MLYRGTPGLQCIFEYDEDIIDVPQPHQRLGALTGFENISLHLCHEEIVEHLGDWSVMVIPLTWRKCLAVYSKVLPQRMCNKISLSISFISV